MVEIANARVQFKRMTRQQWQTSTYIAAEGEMVFETDTGFVKIGDGRSHYTQLRYLTGPQGERGQKGETGERGPAGRDGVVTFENLSQAQRNSLKGDRGERGATGERGPAGRDGTNGDPGPQGPRGDNGEQGHSLSASVRIEGNFRNGVNSQIYVFPEIYFDGVKVTKGYIVDFYYRGFGNDEWTILLNRQLNDNGSIAGWSTAQRRGEYLEVYIVVSYNNLKAAASTRLDNVRDGERGPAGENGPQGVAGQPGQNIINQRTGQPMKYWSGSKAEFDAISSKDAGTIYDYHA